MKHHLIVSHARCFFDSVSERERALFYQKNAPKLELQIRTTICKQFRFNSNNPICVLRFNSSFFFHLNRTLWPNTNTSDNNRNEWKKNRDRKTKQSNWIACIFARYLHLFISLANAERFTQICYAICIHWICITDSVMCDRVRNSVVFSSQALIHADI